MASPARLTCRLCGQEHQSVPLQPGEKARCERCNGLLAVGPRFGRFTALCFALSGLVLLIPSLTLPFVGAEELGDRRVSWLLSGGEAMWHSGMRVLSVLVLLCGTVFPTILFFVLIALYLPERFGRRWIGEPTLAGIAKILFNWSFPEVQVLAVLVGVIKLNSLVDLELGAGFWSYCGMAAALLLARHSYNFDLPPGAQTPLGVLGEEQGGRARFLVLGSSNRATCAALAAAAVVLLFPANYFPVLTTQTSGDNRTDTIFSGAMGLGQQGLWGLAAIVFTASILIPALKLAGIASLLFAPRQPTPAQRRRLTRIYASLEFIGRWSMLDVFLAAFLVGLVQFGEFAKVESRNGLIAFAMVVVLTVAATAAFDPAEAFTARRAPLTS